MVLGIVIGKNVTKYSNTIHAIDNASQFVVGGFQESYTIVDRNHPATCPQRILEGNLTYRLLQALVEIYMRLALGVV